MKSKLSLNVQVEKNSRILGIDFLKGIAIVLVIVGHCLQYGNGKSFFESEGYFYNSLFKFIYSFHMPLFAIISGYLFYYSVSKRTWRESVKKQVKCLIMPVFAWTLTVTIIEKLICVVLKKQQFSLSWIINTTRLCLTNLWYLWGIFWCSIAVICIRYWLNDNILLYLFFFVILLFVPNKLNSDYYVFLYPYFVIGYLWNKYILKIRQFNITKKTVCLITAVYVVMLYFYRTEHYIYKTGTSLFHVNYAEQLKIDLFRWIIGFLGSSLIIIICCWCMQYKNFLVRLISKFGKKTMGMYISNNYLNIYVLLYITSNFTLSYWGTVMESLIMVLLCYGLTCFVSKSKWLNRIYLGGR